MSDTSDDMVIVDGMDEDMEPSLVEEHEVAHKQATASLQTLGAPDVAVTTTTTTTAIKEDLPVLPTPHAVQIVAIEGEEGTFRFEFHKDLLDSILSRFPSDYQVAIVSVVGAFRTGKSFLLSWLLRYLFQQNNNNPKRKNTTHSFASGDKKNSKKWYQQLSSIGNDGFNWKAGSERNTTGIWMWSEAYLNHETRVATFLIDTQGMFDHETTMNLTASIFGFSTLLSSFQIYNVDKRIQEDHLQQLALFSEYARSAMSSNKSADKASSESPDSDDVNVNDDGDWNGGSGSGAPFQHVEFLVRDWQHFDFDDDNLDAIDFTAVEDDMEKYLNEILDDRMASDLQETREQILTCFDTITCYGLCHPGFAVTKKLYTGDVAAIEPLFLCLLDRYCRHVFETARPKTIHGRAVTIAELGTFIEAYALLFAGEDSKFPNAVTLLAATADANNTNAVQLALTNYQAVMDRLVGPKCSVYMTPDELDTEHQQATERSLEFFNSMATFGSSRSIVAARNNLVETLIERFAMYNSLNEGRNPLAGLETFVLPALIGLLSWAMGWFTDMTCSRTVCRAASDFFGHASAVVFCFLAILALTKAKHIHAFFQRLRKAVDVLSGGSGMEATAPTSSRSGTIFKQG